jgi:hypothetical protein
MQKVSQVQILGSAKCSDMAPSTQSNSAHHQKSGPAAGVLI